MNYRPQDYRFTRQAPKGGYWAHECERDGFGVAELLIVVAFSLIVAAMCVYWGNWS